MQNARSVDGVTLDQALATLGRVTHMAPSIFRSAAAAPPIPVLSAASVPSEVSATPKIKNTPSSYGYSDDSHSNTRQVASGVASDGNVNSDENGDGREGIVVTGNVMNDNGNLEPTV